MPFTAEEIANIQNSTLETFLHKGTVFKQNVSNKPMLKAFDEARGSFVGGNEYVSLGIKSGQGGGSLSGFTHDDQVSYYKPGRNKRVKFPWKEHHIGTTITMTELKRDGIDVTEETVDQSTSQMEGREAQALANILDEMNDEVGEDYAVSLNSLLHGDGTTDTKALAGVGSFILDSPGLGTTGGFSRVANTWWRNRASTAAAYNAGTGNNKVTSAATNGGALLQHLQKDLRQLGRYAQGGTRWRFFAGSDFIDALEIELRANGKYTDTGFRKEESVDGAMQPVKWNGKLIEWDPTFDDLSRSKFMQVIDMKRIRLMYMNGQRMKKHNPARPYDRYVMYNGITTTAVMVAQQLNTSAVYEIN